MIKSQIYINAQSLIEVQLFHCHFNFLSLSLDSNDVIWLHLETLRGVILSDGLPIECELELMGPEP